MPGFGRRSSVGGGSGERAWFEALEPRIVLDSVAPDGAVPFVYLGLTPASTRPAVVFTVGTVSPSTGLVLGSDFGEGFNAPTALGPSNLNQFTNLGTGSFSLSFFDGTFFANERSAEFQVDRGFNLGWYGSYNDGFGTYSTGLLLELPESATLDALQGNWQYFLYRIPIAGSTGVSYAGTLSFGGAFATQVLTTTGTGGVPIIRSIEIATEGDNGLFVDNTGNRWYVSADGTTLVTVDPTTSDGFVSIGMAVRASPTVTPADVANIYRLNLLTGAGAADLPFLSDLTFRLRTDGTADFLDTADLDNGIETVLRTGTWSSSGGNLTLVDADGTRIAFTTSVGSDTLAVNNVNGAATNGATVSVFGVASRMPDPFPDGLDPLEVLVSEGDLVFGRPLVYELRADGLWYVTDLLDDTGFVLPGSAMSIETFRDPVTGRVSALVNTSVNAIVLFDRDPADGRWSAATIAPVNQQPNAIMSNIQVVVRAGADGAFGTGDDRAWILGRRTGDGALLAYVQTGEVDGEGRSRWRFENITAVEIVGQGQIMPALTGNITVFVTPWDALHVVGIDLGGNIQSLWTAPGLGGWRVNNLSVIAGTPTIVGGRLEVWVQPYGGINIVGTSFAGIPYVTWWTPGFGSNWESDSLVEVVPGGVNVQGIQLATFSDTLGNATFVSFAQDGSGLFQYRWDRATDAWSADTLVAVVPDPDTPAPLLALRGTTGRNDTLYMYSESAGGDLLVHVRARGASDWTLLNLTDIALPS